uniref:peptidylprolyl isomerase n=1 Tax=Kalanchoe fedtschenkoi TaxID=63787 RepID=A0A7N0TZ14_KALFE
MVPTSAIGLLTTPLNLRPLEASSAKCNRQFGSFKETDTPRNSTVSGLRDGISHVNFRQSYERRQVLISSIGVVAGTMWNTAKDGSVLASEFADSLQYKDLRVGSGPTPKMGDTVVVDWDGYTIGYYGRIFEARNKTKGGSFEGDDKDYFKFRIGSQEVIPAFEEAIMGIAPGGVRRFCFFQFVILIYI